MTATTTITRSGLILVALLAGCGEPGSGVECGPGGERVEVDGRVYCVHPGARAGTLLCPAGLEARVQVSGAVICSEPGADLPASVCHGLPGACVPTCVPDPSFAGLADEIELAEDGGRMAVAGTPIELVNDELWTGSRGGLRVVDGGVLWLHTADSPCDWWHLRPVRVTVDATGAVLGIERQCVEGTKPALRLEVARIHGGVLGCWLGHTPNPVEGVTEHASACGMLDDRGGFVETVRFADGRAVSIAPALGGAVVAFNPNADERALGWLDEAGALTARVSIPAGAPLTVMEVGGEAWGISSIASPAGVRIERFDRTGAPRGDVIIGPPSPTAQSTALAPAGALDDQLAFVLQAGETERPSAAWLGLLRVDETYALRRITEVDGGLATVDVQPWRGGWLILVAATPTDTGVTEARLLRVSCEGRLLEAPLVVAASQRLRPRAVATDGEARAWVVTSEGADGAGWTSHLHRIDLAAGQ